PGAGPRRRTGRGPGGPTSRAAWSSWRASEGRPCEPRGDSRADSARVPLPAAGGQRAALEPTSAACDNQRPMQSPLRVSVLVPVYNEVGTVRALLERVLAIPIRKEIVVVDDGSTDGTRAVLEEVRAATPDTEENRIIVLFQERNQGKGAAVRRA